MDFNIPLTQGILNEIAGLDRFEGRWNAGHGIPADRLERLKEAAIIQSVAASCRLSGMRVSDVEVAGSLRGEGIPVPDGVHACAYARAMAYPIESSQTLITADELKRLHAVLSNGDRRSASEWRSEVYHRESFDGQGKATGRVFATLPPRMIESKVEDLLTWLELELRTRERHPVLIIGTFVLGFLSASPFASGNARLARLLIGRLLQRCGYAYVPYASIERQIEDLRDAYYEGLDRAQSRFWTGEGDLEPWLSFFLQVLSRHRDRVRGKAELEREAGGLPPLQRTILDTVREHGTVDAGLLIRATGANRNTLKDNLRRMVQRGVLQKTGQRRGTRYRLSSGDIARPAI